MKFEERRTAGHIPYHPAINWEEVAAFDERLRSLGSWNTTGRSFLHDGTSDLVRLQWIIPDEKWCSEEGMLQFLDDPFIARLFAGFCFLLRVPREGWAA